MPSSSYVLWGDSLTDCLARGPLIFCLLLSMFLSMRASGEQSSLVFSGVFTIVWIGEAVVTLQIKLLGGNMYVPTCPFGYGLDVRLMVFLLQFVLPVGLHYRIHTLSFGYRCPSQRHGSPDYPPNTRISGFDRVVPGSRNQHPWGLGCAEEPSWNRCLPAICVLYCDWMSLLH